MEWSPHARTSTTYCCIQLSPMFSAYLFDINVRSLLISSWTPLTCTRRRCITLCWNSAASFMTSQVPLSGVDRPPSSPPPPPLLLLWLTFDSDWPTVDKVSDVFTPSKFVRFKSEPSINCMRSCFKFKHGSSRQFLVGWNSAKLESKEIYERGAKLLYVRLA